MYRNPMFLVEDEEAMLEFVRNYPLATLVGLKADGYPVATHTPVLLERSGKGLVGFGHVKQGEEHTTAFLEKDKVILVFQGPNAYISASWYTNPCVASTWNYAAVHAEGTLRCVAKETLEEQLAKTLAQFEGDASPAAYHCLPQAYIDQQLSAIVGFEVKINQWQYVLKLSQNKDRKSRLAVIEQLMTGNGMEQDLALLMYRQMK